MTKAKPKTWIMIFAQPLWHWEVRDHKDRVLAWGDEYEWQFAIKAAFWATTDIRGAMFWGCRVKPRPEER